jgi:hypothetical protein
VIRVGLHYTGSSEAERRVLITGQTDVEGNRKLSERTFIECEWWK